MKIRKKKMGSLPLQEVLAGTVDSNPVCYTDVSLSNYLISKRVAGYGIKVLLNNIYNYISYFIFYTKLLCNKLQK